MSIPYFAEDDSTTPFPDVKTALEDPDGLLAAGGNLSQERLLMAYRQGIFPWYNNDTPILWWSPDPRCVLFPEQIRISRSLRKNVRNGGFEIRQNSAFETVIRSCAQPRADELGTWITDEMANAYLALHHAGYAHSIETWRDGALVGGLYGVAIGRVFFGESMFSHVSNASKVALVHLAQQGDYKMIDCQMATDHLLSLGAEKISREDFVHALKALV